MRHYDVVHKLQDLRHLQWSESGQTSASGGTFLKARQGVGAQASYYKLSCYDSYRGIYGHECVNEVVASRLCAVLGVEHVRYTLVHALVQVDGQEYETWLVRSKSFRKANQRKMTFDTFFDLMHEQGESQLEFCNRFGWLEDVQKMMLIDYLLVNRDRHGANIEVLRDAQGNMCLAPLFDTGISLVFSCYADESRVRSFDALADVPANNYIGTRSLEENLQFVPCDLAVGELVASDKEMLVGGLCGAVSQTHIEAMWNIVWQRWQRWEKLKAGRA